MNTLKLTPTFFLLFFHLINFSQNLGGSDFENSQPGFIENKGQIYNENGTYAAEVLFALSANNLTVYLTEKGLTYSFNRIARRIENDSSSSYNIEQAWFNINLKNASIQKSKIEKQRPNKETYNYIINDYSSEKIGLFQYKKMIVKDVYEGIDWMLYADDQNKMKFEFLIHPNANPNQIELLYEGDSFPEKKEDGSLAITTKLGVVNEHKPVVYSVKSNENINSAFKVQKVDEWNTKVTYALDDYNSEESIIIDPILEWGTFFAGGGVNGARSMTCDLEGNLFLTGEAGYADFPLLDAGTYYSATEDPGGNVFISKFSPAGVLLWSTFYGSTADNEVGMSIVADHLGNIFVAGETFSNDIPLLDAGTYYDGIYNGFRDPFILKFDNDGNYLWGTYFGGNDIFDDYITEIDVDEDGNLFFFGWTDAFDSDLIDAGTYFDGVRDGPTDMILAKFDNEGDLLWSTYIGGSEFDYSAGIEITGSSDVYIVGYGNSGDYPTLAGAGYYDGAIDATADGIITRFDNDGNMTWSTFFGGADGPTEDYDVAIHSVISDDSDNIFITGTTHETSFPVMDAGTYFDNTLGGGLSVTLYGSDFFISKFNSSNELLWSTYHGGSELESYLSGTTEDNVGIDSCGNLYVLIGTRSDDILTNDPGCGSFYNGTYSGDGDASMWGTAGGADMHLSKFSNNGELLWGTYLGSNNTMIRSTLAVECFQNDVYVATHNGIDFGNPDNHTLIPLNNPGGGAYFDNSITETEKITILKFVPDTLQVTAAISDASCTCDGAIDLTVCGTPPFTYLWNTGATSEDITEACMGSYSVIIYDSSCPVRRDTFYYEVDGPIDGMDLTEAHIDPICGSGGEATISVAGGTPTYSYLWDAAAGDQTTATAVGLEEGTYTCTITDSDGCIGIISVTLIDTAECALYVFGDTICEGMSGSISALASFGIAPYTYIWAGGIPEGAGPHSMSPDVTTSYDVTVTDATGLVMTETAIVVVLSEPIVDLGPDTVICEGSVLLDAENDGANYLWNDLSSDQTLLVNSSGVFYVQVNNGGCFATDTIDITVSNLMIDLGPDTVLCIADLVLDAGNPGASFSWNDLSTEQWLEITDPGIYYTTVTDVNGCQVSDTITILIDEPLAIFSVSDTVGCTPLVVSFTDLSTSSSLITSWNWTFGDGGASLIQHPNHNYTTSGVYTVFLQIENANGCVSDTNKTVTVDVYPQPIANFQFSPDSPEIGTEVVFEDLSVDATSWFWDFGDGHTATVQNPTHTFSTLGNFDVVLMVENYNCRDSVNRVIVLGEELLFFVPNAFTPDGDIFNNTFSPVFTAGFDPYDYHLTIFNRWGETLFESFNAEIGWNGEYQNGQLVQDGVYIWKIEFGDANNDKIHLFNGHVTILK